MAEDNENQQSQEQQAGGEQTDQPAGEVQQVSAEPADVKKDDMNMAMLAHLLAIFTGFLGPLIIWLIKKEESPYVDRHGKEALNFQLTVLLAFIASGILSLACIGLVLMPVVWVVDIIFCIIAAVKASRGEEYRYPLSIRLVK